MLLVAAFGLRAWGGQRRRQAHAVFAGVRFSVLKP